LTATSQQNEAHLRSKINSTCSYLYSRLLHKMEL